MQASELNPSHVGSKVSYGPRMMFTGTIAGLTHLTDGWLKHARGGDEIVQMTTPPRVLVLTNDGRAATLAYHEEVTIEGER